jgi:starch phosphorylase
MSEQTRISHPKEHPLPTEVERFDSLAELALDLRSLRDSMIVGGHGM